SLVGPRMFSFRVVGSPREGNAGEVTELVRLVPGELPDEVALLAPPEEPQRFRAFGEGEEAAALVLRGETFEEPEVGCLVDLRAASGDGDALHQGRPVFAVRARNDLGLAKVG